MNGLLLLLYYYIYNYPHILISYHRLLGQILAMIPELSGKKKYKISKKKKKYSAVKLSKHINIRNLRKRHFLLKHGFGRVSLFPTFFNSPG